MIPLFRYQVYQFYVLFHRVWINDFSVKGKTLLQNEPKCIRFRSTRWRSFLNPRQSSINNERRYKIRHVIINSQAFRLYATVLHFVAPLYQPASGVTCIIACTFTWRELSPRWRRRYKEGAPERKADTKALHYRASRVYRCATTKKGKKGMKIREESIVPVGRFARMTINLHRVTMHVYW